jgi:glycerol-1-phosphatase
VRLADRHDLLIFDLDGVVYLGSSPITGAADAINAVGRTGRAVAFATNNASRRADEVAQLLRSLGVDAGLDQVVTSAQAAASLLAGRLPAGSRVLIVGAPALAGEVEAVGLAAVTRADDRPVAVVQGYGPQVGWPDLAEACVAIHSGALWVATNLDPTLPSPRGPLPGNGSLVAALATAVGRRPDAVVGKPEPELFRTTMARQHSRDPLVVGDRLDTDIEGAARAGMASLLVLTGVACAGDVLAAPDGRRPTYLAADLGGLSTEVDRVRVPDWDGERARSGDWCVTVEQGRLRLRGSGAPVDALRALVGAAWSNPQWTEVVPDGDPARAVLTSLDLAGSATRNRAHGPGARPDGGSAGSAIRAACGA